MRLGGQRDAPDETPGKRSGAWWTPPTLAAQVARWARVRPGDLVVDAGAGEGSLTIAFRELGAKVIAVELADRSVRTLDRLRAATIATPLDVVHANFLAWHPGIVVPLTVTNPPWEGDIPHRFLLHALTFSDRAIGIVPESVFNGVVSAEGRGGVDPLWGVAQPLRIAHCVRRPNFDPANDGGQRDCAIVEVARRAKPGTRPVRPLVEWWHERWD